MDKAEDCDSDGSLSWEDFFGSSTDLVPSLLNLYDSLLADRLSSDGVGQFARRLTNKPPGEGVGEGREGSGLGWGSGTSSSSVTKNWTQSATSGAKKGLSSTMGGGGCISPTSGTGKGCDWDSTVPVSKSTTRGMELQGSSNNKSNNNCGSGSASAGKPDSNNSNHTSANNSTSSVKTTLVKTSVTSGPLLNRVHWTTTNLPQSNQKSQEKGNNGPLNKNLSNGVGGISAIRLGEMSENQNKRPLSVNSIVSSTSSSSCSSESSSSLGNVLGLGTGTVAPRASPEEDDSPLIPDVNMSDLQGSFSCAKNKENGTISSENGSSDGCFSSSANKECGETATNSNGRARISFPIQTPANYRFCDPDLSYMDRVVLEIVETERIYVNDLLEVISGYLDHWINQPDDSLALEDIKELFSNIEEIHHFNSEFLTRLEDCGLNPVEIARCFVTKNEGFSVYTLYCTNYPRTMSLLTEMMRQEQSAKSFRERQASLGHSLPLGSYLLKPVQRILKYHLLLQNIVKHFEERNEGFETIVEALSAMTNIAHHINDMKRKHEHAVRVQEIQSLLYGWQGEDLTTYGELCAEGTFRAYGAKALRHVFLFDKMVLITKKKEDGILCYKTHIMCSNLMLVESVPGEPLSFHVIPFDNPRLQCTLQARNLEQKRGWTLQLKRVLLESYSAVIPSHARQLVMELGMTEKSGNMEKAPTRRQHSAPEYLERRKQEKDRRKSESSLKARLKRGRKSDMMSPKEGFGRRSRKNSTDSSRERSESRDSHEREVSIDRKMSSASCPPSGSGDKKLVKKLSGWRRKSEPGIYPAPETAKMRKENGLMSPNHGTSNLTLDSTSSIGEEDERFLEEEEPSSRCTDMSELDESVEDEGCQTNVEERRESVEEIVGQLVMQNREFQRILSKQRLVHLRKALTQYQRRCLHEEESASETETEETCEKRKSSVDGKNISSGSNASQSSSSNGIGSSSDMAEMSSENICIEPNDDVLSTTKNVQRTVSDPGNKATLTPRRFMSGPFAQYDPLSLLWSSFRRNDNRSKNVGSPTKSKGKTSIRHTHSFSCSRKDPNHQGADEVEKDPLPLPHGDSGVFPNSFTSDSSSSSEANIPTLPAVWLKQQDEHLATPNNKSGSLPRSFQVGQQHVMPTPMKQPTRSSDQSPDDLSNILFKSRTKLTERPITIASDKPTTSDLGYDEMEDFMNKFNDQMSRKESHNLENGEEDIDDLALDITPTTSLENISDLHPDHKIYRPSKSSIKHMLLSVTHRLSGLKVNMLSGSSATRENVNFGSFSNISSTSDTSSTKTSKNPENGRKMSNGNGNGLKNLNMLPRNYRKALKQKLRNIVREDRDSDCEESVTCSSGSSGFGSLGGCESPSNLTSKIGARLAHSSEQSDYALSKLLGSVLNESLNGRPHSVMSVSSTVTSTSSTDEKTSSGFGDSLSGSSTHIQDCGSNGHPDVSETLLEGITKSIYRTKRKGINHKELYLSYIDQDADAHSDSDASADSFYERSFEAIESLLESELFPDSAIYSAEENASANSSIQGSQYSSSWGLSSSFQDSLDSSSPSIRLPFSTNSISMLAARLSNCRMPSSPSKSSTQNRRSRLIRSQAIIEKLKHLEECSQFHREDLPSPSFEGMKSIQERRNELELWKQGRISRGEDECETSSQHSTSTINTVIEMSPSKSTSFPSSRRCSDTDSSGGNSPLTERAISRNSMYASSSSNGNLIGDPMTQKGWVKLVVGKLQGADAGSAE